MRNRIYSTISSWIVPATFAAFIALPTAASAASARFCVFDPLGTSGDAYAAARDYKTQASRWGIELELKAYTDERIAAEDLKAGQCDMATMTGLRARNFNKFTGSFDSVGALENYAQVRTAMNLLASPRLEPLMKSGDYEVFGMFPLGAGYAFMNDRRINTLAKAAGKKVAVMEWDKSQSTLIQLIGAQPVNADISTFAGLFNNGAVDIVVSPIIAYKPLELYRGLANNGGIARFPLIQVSLQMVGKSSKFPPGYGQKSRAHSVKEIDRAIAVIRREENAVDPKHWMYVSRTERESYVNSMRDARSMLAKDGVYDRRMLNLLKRVRCNANPTEAECSLGAE